ncbi:hypothetical protein [Runella sp.]|uniref:hypothetical protein n=1 Tax=Runella sp. TaxID=1960881 RepID=UPI003D14A0E5
MQKKRQIISIFVLWVAIFALAGFSRSDESLIDIPAFDSFKKNLVFQKHQFEISTSESGAIRELVIKVSRDNQQLIVIRQKTDGWVVNAETADLNRNGSPEIYIYASTYGSGSFGKIYAFEFFPTSFDAIRTEPLLPMLTEGYMGHDSFKIENGQLIREFPIYRAGDTNVRPTGGNRKIWYELREIEKKLTLKAVEYED